jgi:hypothetical protein
MDILPFPFPHSARGQVFPSKTVSLTFIFFSLPEFFLSTFHIQRMPAVLIAISHYAFWQHERQQQQQQTLPCLLPAAEKGVFSISLQNKGSSSSSSSSSGSGQGRREEERKRVQIHGDGGGGQEGGLQSCRRRRQIHVSYFNSLPNMLLLNVRWRKL